MNKINLAPSACKSTYLNNGMLAVGEGGDCLGKPLDRIASLARSRISRTMATVATLAGLSGLGGCTLGFDWNIEGRPYDTGIEQDPDSDDVGQVDSSDVLEDSTYQETGDSDGADTQADTQDDSDQADLLDGIDGDADGADSVGDTSPDQDDSDEDTIPQHDLCADPENYCGDGQCGQGETPEDCAIDCLDGVNSTCGDGHCDSNGGENTDNCVTDCGMGAFCGDGVCQPPDETCGTCATDCYACPGHNPNVLYGNGECDSSLGENCENAELDCGICVEARCGDGFCAPGEQDCNIDCDPAVASVGDGRCSTQGGEAPGAPVTDCGCEEIPQ